MAKRNIVLMKSRIVERPDNCYDCEKFNGNTGECDLDQLGSNTHGYNLVELHQFVIDEQFECVCIWMAALPG